MRRAFPVSIYLVLSSGKTTLSNWAQCGQVIEAYSTMTFGASWLPSDMSGRPPGVHQLGEIGVFLWRIGIALSASDEIDIAADERRRDQRADEDDVDHAGSAASASRPLGRLAGRWFLGFRHALYSTSSCAARPLAWAGLHSLKGPLPGKSEKCAVRQPLVSLERAEAPSRDKAPPQPFVLDRGRKRAGSPASFASGGLGEDGSALTTGACTMRISVMAR